MKKEVWKPVVTHHEYEVSNRGRVRNAEGHMIAITKEHRGEGREVTLCNRGARDKLRLARVVGAAFNPDFRDHLRPKFRDGDKSNCWAENLTWAPMSEISFRPTGEKQGASKLTWVDVVQIRELHLSGMHTGEILSKINCKHGVDVSVWTISSVIYFATWKPESAPDAYRKQAIKQYDLFQKNKAKRTAKKAR